MAVRPARRKERSLRQLRRAEKGRVKPLRAVLAGGEEAHGTFAGGLTVSDTGASVCTGLEDEAQWRS